MERAIRMRHSGLQPAQNESTRSAVSFPGSKRFASPRKTKRLDQGSKKELPTFNITKATLHVAAGPQIRTL